MSFVEFPIETDPDELVLDQYAAIQDVDPLWRPKDGNLDDMLLRADSRMAAVANDTAATYTREIFRDFGRTLAGVPPLEAAPATGTATVVMLDALGHTLPAGVVLQGEGPDGGPVLFELLEDVVVPAGSTTSVAGAAQLAATEGGDRTNDVVGELTTTDYLATSQGTPFVASVTLTEGTQGGSDAEDPELYDNRLSEWLSIATPRPIVAAHVQPLLRVLVPGVERVMVKDNYEPGPPANLAAAGTTSVWPVDASGNSSTGLRDACSAVLATQRETGYVWHVLAPTLTDVTIAFVIDVDTVGDPDDVVANAEVAVQTFLSRSTWGSPAYGQVPDWQEKKTVAHYDVAAVLLSVEGVRGVPSLTINGSTSADAVLAGYGALPGTVLVSGDHS